MCWPYRLLLRRITWSIGLPKFRGQVEGTENLGHLGRGAAAIMGREPIVIPQLGKHPEFLGCERLPWLPLVLTLPLRKGFFRPEELDRCSREDHILIPLTKRHQDVNDGGGVDNIALVNL